LRVLLTGAGGFLGSHILRRLEGGEDMHLTLLDLPGADLPRGMRRIRCDLSDQEATVESLQGRTYDVLIHLFGLRGRYDYARLQTANALGTRNLLMALENRVSRAVIAGSWTVYGEVIGDDSLDELSYVDPASAYGRSMAAREALAREMAGLYGTEISILRLFSLVGPGQSSAEPVSGMARELAEIKLRQRPPRMHTGPLDVRRDYVDVRDAARAFTAAMSHSGPIPERMNVASGRARSRRELLQAMAGSLGVDPEVEEERGSGPLMVRGDAALVKRTLGWKAEIPLSRTLADVIREWIRALRAPSSGR